MQVSGDLGKAGKLTELLALVTPRFQIGSHGIAVGNNLLKAYVELDRTTEARALLERLYAAQRPDWRETLAYWERTIDDKTRGFGPVNEPVPAIAIVQLIGPSWCREKEGFATLLAPKAAAAPRVAVMMPSCNPSKPSGVSVSQRTNAEGALSRAIALALAESVHLDTSAVGIALVPILAPPSGGGFVLAGAPASIDALRNAAGQSVAAIASLHLNAETDPWQLSMTVHATNTTSPDTNRQIEVPIDPAKPEGALASLRAVLKSAALELSGATATLRPEWARPPHGDELASWLAGTEQCLAVVCADPSHGGAAISLYGERSIVDGILSAAVARPESVPWRMLLVTVLNRLVEARPEIAGEYFDRAERLMREHAVGGDIGSAIAHVLSALRERQPKHS
jgi:hypothetical protein